MSISDLLGHRITVFDGAMGTALQAAGLGLSEQADVWNITHPDAVKNVHLEFLRAGADVLTTNTFGASANVLGGSGYTTAEVVAAAVANAKAAIDAYDEEFAANQDPGGGREDYDTEAGVFTCIAVNPEDGSGACALPVVPVVPVMPVGAAVTGVPSTSGATARPSAHYVAAGFGPCRQMLGLPGGISFEDAYDLFREEVIAAKQAGADIILFETFSDILELKAAVLAAKENADLPVFTTLTFQENGRTLLGTDALTAVNVLQSLGVDALGVNCSLGPVQTLPIVKDLTANALVHVICQPNAGLPTVNADGSITYDLTPDAFADSVFEMIEYGAAVVGGCCGTTPDFIRALRARIDAISHEDRPGRFPSLDPGWFGWKLEGAQPSVCSATETIFLDRTFIGLKPGRSRREEQWLKPGDSSLFMEPEFGPVVLPEELAAGYIDPATNEEYWSALIAGDYEQAAECVDSVFKDGGGDIMYISAIAPDAPEGYDEVTALAGVVSVLSETGLIPLVIEGSGPEAIGRALRICKGKPGVSLGKLGGTGEGPVRQVAEKYGAEVVEWE
jgi:5-methyltetrahydrofolate--homocysteine methyltransferase